MRHDGAAFGAVIMSALREANQATDATRIVRTFRAWNRHGVHAQTRKLIVSSNRYGVLFHRHSPAPNFTPAPWPYAIRSAIPA
jgi:hypothetical protein